MTRTRQVRLFPHRDQAEERGDLLAASSSQGIACFTEVRLEFVFHHVSRITLPRRAHQFPPGEVLQHLNVDFPVSDDLLQPTVLIFDLFQTFVS